jgi:hypothetical protein
MQLTPYDAIILDVMLPVKMGSQFAGAPAGLTRRLSC